MWSSSPLSHGLSPFLLATGLVFAAAVTSGQEPASEDSTLRHHTAHHRFDDAERWSKQFDSAERDSWQKPDEVIEAMEISEGMTAADIGAGTGYFVAHLSHAVGAEGRVLGLDVESAMVEFMTERAEREGWSNVEARVVAPDDPGLGAGTVDRILVVNTWHHIGDRAAYSRLLSQGLRADGRIFIVDFTLDSPHGPPVNQRLTPEQVIEELEAGGLEAQLLREDLPAQYIVVAHRP